MNNRITSNLFWRFLERFGAQGVTLVVSIILARILDPEIYGTVALVTVFTTIFQVFVDSGLGTALIQKQGADSEDFSTVFFTNFGLCILLYVALFFCAPFIASFYNDLQLVSIVRVSGIIIIISGFKGIQNAYVSKHLLFKKYFFATLGGTIVAAFVGVFMAYRGYGVWALVVQNIVNQLIDTVILWIIVPWKPTMEFSFSKLRGLFSYGWKLLLASLIDTVWIELRTLIIGKKYNADDLAFYNKGEEYPKYATQALNGAINSVLLPVMSNEQSNPERVKAITRKAIKTSSFVLWPMMMGLASCSYALVSLVLTDKWLPAVPYLVVFCFVYAFYPIHTANLNAIKAMGRSDYFLILEIIKKILNLAIILTTMWFGVFWIAIGAIFGTISSQIINSWPNRKLLQYGYLEQLKDLAPSLLLSCAMGCVVYCVNFLGFSNSITLLIQIPLGVVFYLGVAYLFKMESLIYCIDVVKGFFKKKKEK